MNILERDLPQLDECFRPSYEEAFIRVRSEKQLSHSYKFDGTHVGGILSTWSKHSKICRLHDLYVEPEFRDRNITLHLFQGVLREMVTEGITTVIGNAEPYEYEDDEPVAKGLGRRRALARFYAQLGFSIDRYWNIKMDISCFSSEQVEEALLVAE